MWSKDRREEFILLSNMVHQVDSLHGSHFLKRVAQCIEIAEKLLKSDISKPRESFMNFLKNEAMKTCKWNKDEMGVYTCDNCGNLSIEGVEVPKFCPGCGCEVEN